MYNVHLETRALVDTTRATPANGTAPALAQRNLPTDLRIPILQADAGSDVPRAYPLVIFVHGSASGRATSTFLLDGPAARGYVVAAADFPLTALNTPGGASDWHVEDQLGDLKFLTDTFFAASRDASDTLFGKIDQTSGVSIVGHSTGGTVALLAALAPSPHDDRVRAAVSISGPTCFLANSLYLTRALPLLFIGASADALVPPEDNVQRAYGLSLSPAMLAMLQGATHLFFTDLPLADSTEHGHAPTASDPLAQTLALYGGGTGCTAQTVDAPSLTFDEQHALTIELAADFLDATLRSQDAPLSLLLQELPPALSMAQK